MFGFQTSINEYPCAQNFIFNLFDDDYLDEISVFSKAVDEFQTLDDARLLRRNSATIAKVIIDKNQQLYLDFLQLIFSTVTNIGAPFECVVPKQLAGYGLLYLQYLF